MSFQLFVSNAEGLNLGPEPYESVCDAIAAATRHIARRRGTGWRVRVLDEETGRVRAWYEVDASPETYAPFVGARFGLAAPAEPRSEAASWPNGGSPPLARPQGMVAAVLGRGGLGSRLDG